jgi:nickel-dependent lactate racemase
MTGVDFALDVTLNRDQQITAAFAGELSGACRACQEARRNAMRGVDEPFDIVVTTNPLPLDQSVSGGQGYAAAAKIVKTGTIVCAAECRWYPHSRSVRTDPGLAAVARALLDMIESPATREPINGRFRFGR